MRKSIFTILTFLLVSQFSLMSQEKYFVAFTNKQGTPFTIEKPSEFLSERAIQRRNKQGIAVTEFDLPVSQNYLQELQQTGAKVLYPLKWFNGAVVEVYNEAMVTQILSKSFVSEVIMVYTPNAKAVPLPEEDIFPVYSSKIETQDYYDYGSSSTQVKMLNGHKLHNLGFRGQGMLIAVLDAGFLNVNILPAFDSVNQNGQIIAIKDFVNPESNIYQEHSHGTIVLSAIAGNLPGQLIGTAPEANFVLIRSEDGASEQIVEEYNWVAAAEFADSIGSDVISSSLGYYVFDAYWQNHTYSSMNGETTPAAKAANFAANVGMIVVASAGNEGNNDWMHIITPSDAFGCIAVGAVDASGYYVPFSSVGPSADGRVKPDVVAMGRYTVVQSPTGELGTASGTSLSAPLISGMIACLWQGLPGSSAEDIRKFLVRSASNYSNPDFTLGYGIPNFELALNSINSEPEYDKKLSIFPNPALNQVTLFIPWEGFNELNIKLMDLTGRIILEKVFNAHSSFYTFEFPGNLSSGTYLIQLNKGAETITGKVVKYNK